MVSKTTTNQFRIAVPAILIIACAALARPALVAIDKQFPETEFTPTKLEQLDRNGKERGELVEGAQAELSGIWEQAVDFMVDNKCFGGVAKEDFYDEPEWVFHYPDASSDASKEEIRNAPTIVLIRGYFTDRQTQKKMMFDCTLRPISIVAGDSYSFLQFERAEIVHQ